VCACVCVCVCVCVRVCVQDMHDLNGVRKIARLAEAQTGYGAGLAAAHRGV
jgi:hypothetical protein